MRHEIATKRTGVNGQILGVAGVFGAAVDGVEALGVAPVDCQQEVTKRLGALILGAAVLGHIASPVEHRLALQQFHDAVNAFANRFQARLQGIGRLRIGFGFVSHRILRNYNCTRLTRHLVTGRRGGFLAAHLWQQALD